MRLNILRRRRKQRATQVELVRQEDAVLYLSTSGQSCIRISSPRRLSIRESMGLNEDVLDTSSAVRMSGSTASGAAYPRDFDSYQDYLDAYRYVPFVSRAFEIKCYYIWQSGYDLEGEESSTEVASEILQDIDADTVIREGTMWALVFGNMYWHVERNPVRLRPLNPLGMGVRRDAKGNVKGYVCRSSGGVGDEYRAGDVLHLRIGSEPWDLFGFGMIRPVLATLKHILYMKRYLPEIARNRADPWLHFTIRDPETGMPYPNEQFQWIKEKTTSRRPGENLFDDGSVQVQEVYQTAGVGGRQTIDGILASFQSDLIAGLGVPEIMLAFGSTTLKGTALVQEQAFESEIRGIQRILKRFHERQLWPLLGIPPDVKLAWRPLKPEDKVELSRRFMEEIEHGVITPEYARQMLGYPQLEEMGGNPLINGTLTPLASSGEGEEGDS